MVRSSGGKSAASFERTRGRMLNHAVVIGTAMLADMFIGIAKSPLRSEGNSGNKAMMSPFLAIAGTQQYQLGSSCFSSVGH